MGSSSGLIHHYFASMDDVLAAAFERVAERGSARDGVGDGGRALSAGGARGLLRAYAPVEADWAFQLWLDAWAEAARRPAIQATSTPPQPALARLLQETIRRASGPARFRCHDPSGAAWRILSLVDGLALQVVAHAHDDRRADVVRLGGRGLGTRARAPTRSARLEERPPAAPTSVGVTRRRPSADSTGRALDDRLVDPAATPPAPSVHLRI